MVNKTAKEAITKCENHGEKDQGEDFARRYTNSFKSVRLVDHKNCRVCSCQLQEFAESTTLCRHVALARYFEESNIDEKNEAHLEAYCNKMCDVGSSQPPRLTIGLLQQSSSSPTCYQRDRRVPYSISMCSCARSTGGGRGRITSAERHHFPFFTGHYAYFRTRPCVKQYCWSITTNTSPYTGSHNGISA
jgi:hypothetical protein